MLRRLGHLGLWSVTVVSLLMLGSCLKVRLGDPATSKVDPQLRGYWHSSEEAKGNLAIIAPFDEHAYVVESFAYKKEGDQIKVEGHSVFRAWLTPIKGQQFLTMESVQYLADPQAKDKVYPTYKVALKDNQILAHLLNNEYAKFSDVQTPGQLAKVIEQNIDDPTMYDKEVATWQRLDPEKDKALIESITK